MHFRKSQTVKEQDVAKLADFLALKASSFRHGSLGILCLKECIREFQYTLPAIPCGGVAGSRL